MQRGDGRGQPTRRPGGLLSKFPPTQSPVKSPRIFYSSPTSAAVQLNSGYRIDECRRAVDMIQADALFLHLNPLQEAVQAGGDTNFAGLAKKIERICKKLEVPVIIKEVGWGISERNRQDVGRVWCRCD